MCTRAHEPAVAHRWDVFKQLVQRADDGAPSLFVVSRFPLQGTTDNSVAVTASVSAFFVDEAVGHISILAHVRQRCRLRATRLHRGCYHADVEIAGDSSSPRPCIFPRHWVWSPFGAFSVTPVQHLPILSGSDSGKASGGRGARRFSGPPASQAPSAASVRASKIRAPLRARFRTATCSTHHAPWVYELYVPRHRGPHAVCLPSTMMCSHVHQALLQVLGTSCAWLGRAIWLVPSPCTCQPSRPTTKLCLIRRRGGW